MRPRDLQAPWKFVPPTHRGRSGFTLVLTVVMGIILTVLALTIMASSMNEVKVASSQNIATSALNAAESAGSVALNTLSERGNSIAFPTSTTPSQILSYICLDNPLWVSVELPSSSDTLRTTQYNSVAQANATFLKPDGTTVGNTVKADGTTVPNTSQAFDPLKMAPNEVDSWSSNTTSLAIVKKHGATTQLGTSSFGIKGLTASAANCPSGATANSPGSPTKGYSYMPGTPGLAWTAAESDSLGNFVLPNQKLSTIGDYQVCGQATIQGFRLTMVEVVSDSTTNRHVPSGIFRLMYTYNLQSEGQIRAVGATECGGKVVGRQIIRAPNILIVDLVPPGSSFAQYSTFVDKWTSGVYFGPSEVYDGRTHTNQAPSFGFNSGQIATVFSGEFSSAGCGSKTTAASACPNGTYSTVGNGGGATVDTWATFQYGSKFLENGGAYVPKPSDGGYQLKAALTGQKEPSASSNDDVMKLSEVRTALGVQVGTGSAAEAAPPPGVYWVNPTDRDAASSASGKATSYSDWLGKATSTSNTYNSSSNLLPGVYINGDVDYINMYAAKSIPTVAAADVQVVEIKQGSSKYKFTMTKTSTKVAVDTGSGSVTENTYNKAMTGLFFVDGNVGDKTQNCNTGSSTKESCKGLISAPPDTSAASLSFISGSDTPTIQQDWGVTIAANGNVAIQDNLNYQVDPRGADKKYDNIPNNTIKDDPPMSQAQNILGIVTFDDKKVKGADGITITTSPVNGTTDWGSGLKNQSRVDKDPNGNTVDTVDIQASIFGYSQGSTQTRYGYTTPRLAEYIRLLGGQIQTQGGFDALSGNCTTTLDLSSKGGPRNFKSTGLCGGANMYLIADQRTQNGFLTPPGFPSISLTIYTAKPIGRQSIGKVRWQTLPYQTL
jgi:Tfp pilus assembly protein PilX